MNDSGLPRKVHWESCIQSGICPSFPSGKIILQIYLSHLDEEPPGPQLQTCPSGVSVQIQEAVDLLGLS